MIIVNVFIPLMDKEYEFKLNEDIPVCWIIEEITSLICQKEQYVLSTLSVSLSLYENDIKSGDRLILA